MCPLTRPVAASLVLALLAGNAIAQQGMLDTLLGRLSSVEITTDTANLVVMRATTKQSADAAPAVLAISCHRGTDSTPSEYLAVQDHAARTDDRYGVEIGFCDALVNAVAQRNRTLKR